MQAARHPSHRPRPVGALGIALVGVTIAFISTAALLAACGGSSGGPSPISSASAAGPSAQPSPQITAGRPPAGAVAVVRQYWRYFGEQRYEQAHALTTGDHLAASSLWSSPPSEPEVKAARFLRVIGDLVNDPGGDATLEFPFDVHIVPSAASPFGDAPVDQAMWARVVRMSDGSWRVVELGTSP